MAPIRENTQSLQELDLIDEMYCGVSLLNLKAFPIEKKFETQEMSHVEGWGCL